MQHQPFDLENVHKNRRHFNIPKWFNRKKNIFIFPGSLVKANAQLFPFYKHSGEHLNVAMSLCTKPGQSTTKYNKPSLI